MSIVRIAQYRILLARGPGIAAVALAGKLLAQPKGRKRLGNARSICVVVYKALVLGALTALKANLKGNAVWHHLVLDARANADVAGVRVSHSGTFRLADRSAVVLGPVL